MSRLHVQLGLSVAVCLPLLAAPSATTLEPISPVGWDLAAESAVWSDGAGQLANARAVRLNVRFGAQGGRTTVRVDRVEIADANGSTSYRRQWYSPNSAWYQLSRDVDWASLEVRVYLQVMNEHLSVGPLYANSRNRLVWKPAVNRWLRFEPFAYEVD